MGGLAEELELEGAEPAQTGSLAQSLDLEGAEAPTPKAPQPDASGYATRGIAGVPTGLGRPGSTDQPDTTPLASSLQENVVEPVTDALTAAGAVASRALHPSGNYTPPPDALGSLARESYGAGQRSVREAERAREAAHQRSPAAATMGEIGVAMAAPQSRAGGLAGAATNVGIDTAVGYAEGGDEGAESAAEWSAGINALGPLGRLARKATAGPRMRVADQVGDAASRRRLSAGGAYGNQIKKLEKAKPGAAADYGRRAEKLGMDRADWYGNYERAKAVKDEVGARLGQLRGQITGGVNMERVADRLIQDADELQKLGSVEANKAAESLLAEADQILQAGPKSYDEALKLRQNHDSMVWNEVGKRDTAKADHHRLVAAYIRDELTDAAERESPALAGAVKDALKDYEVAAFFSTVGEQRLAQEAGNWAVSAPSVLSGAVGLATGHTLTGMAATGLTEAAKRYGAATAANTGRAVERAIRPAGAVEAARGVLSREERLRRLARGAAVTSALQDEERL